MLELPDDIHFKVKDLCKQGDDLANLGSYEDAKSKYIAALDLLPGKPWDWAAGTWIYVAIGDVHFRTQNFEKSFKCFYNAVQSPQGLGNPFIHLRLGQLYFEQGNMDKAADELTRAFMGGGLQIMMEDDPKYLDFLETQIDIQ